MLYFFLFSFTDDSQIASWKHEIAKFLHTTFEPRVALVIRKIEHAFFVVSPTTEGFESVLWSEFFESRKISRQNNRLPKDKTKHKICVPLPQRFKTTKIKSNSQKEHKTFTVV